MFSNKYVDDAIMSILVKKWKINVETGPRFLNTEKILEVCNIPCLMYLQVYNGIHDPERATCKRKIYSCLSTPTN